MAGRKKIPIDWNRVSDMAQKFCTGTEIAAALGISYDTLTRACKREKNADFAEYLRQKRESGKNTLRQLQLKSAMEGSIPMQIWLGKQYLDQSDKREQKIQQTHDIPQFRWADDEADG